MLRVLRFTRSLFSDWVTKVLAILIGLIGTIQSFASLIQITGSGPFRKILDFFVSPWNGEIWVIFIFGSLVMVLFKRAYLLGAYQMDISLAQRSRPLRKGDERYLALEIINNSPKPITGTYVNILAIKLEGNPHWKPDQDIERHDKFLWSAWLGKESMRLDRDIRSGHSAMVDLFRFQQDRNYFYTRLQTGELSITTTGNFIMDVLLSTVYEGKRHEFPISVGLDFDGGMNIANVRFENKLSYDWRISDKFIIEII